MQPDTIIQNKEWAALTEAEKQVLAPLVTDEAAFRLLKKALLVSRETAAGIPAIDPFIKEILIKQFAEKTPVRKLFFSNWRKFAAAIFLLAICSTGYWMWKKNKKTETEFSLSKTQTPFVPDQPVQPPNKLQRTIPQHPATAPEFPVTAQREVKPTRQPAALNSKKYFSKKESVVSYSASVNTRVQSDTLLLAYITEVY
jgi:hypothetical protein